MALEQILISWPREKVPGWGEWRKLGGIGGLSGEDGADRDYQALPRAISGEDSREE